MGACYSQQKTCCRCKCVVQSKWVVHTHVVYYAGMNSMGNMPWFGFNRAALLLAVVTCIALSFEAIPGLCCFLRVTQA